MKTKNLVIYLTSTLFLLVSHFVSATEWIQNLYPTSIVTSIIPDSTVHLHAIESWQNYLYVAYNKEEQYKIDIFDIHNVNHPVKIKSLDFGVAVGGRVPFTPLTIAPRSKVLIIQANDQFHYYKQLGNGDVEELNSDPFEFMDPLGAMQQLSISDDWGSMTQIVKGEYQKRLINFTNPKDPYFVKGFDGNISGDINCTLNGLPGSLTKNLLLGSVNIKKLNPVDFQAHQDVFWTDVLNQTMNPASLNTSIQSVNQKVLDGVDAYQLMHQAIEKYKASLTVGNQNIKEFILSHYEGDLPLQTVLDDRNISLDQPFAVVVRQIVAESFTDDLNKEISKILFQRSLEQWSKDIIGQLEPNGSVTNLYKKFEDAIGAKYDSEKLAAYLSEDLIGPLLGNPDFIKWTVKDMIDYIVASDASGAIDATLTMGDYLLSPTEIINEILDIVDISKPRCANWPDNTRELLEMFLYHNNANINPDGNAWYEFLKYNTYLNGNDFSDWEKEFDTSIKQIHADLAKGAVDRISEAVRISDDLESSINGAINEYIQNIPSLNVLENAITYAILTEFNSIAISGDITVRQLLERIDFPMVYSSRDLTYVPAGTLNEFFQKLGEAYIIMSSATGDENVIAYKSVSTDHNQILTLKLNQYFTNGENYYQNLTSHIQKFLEEYSMDAFGSTTLTVREAMLQNISSRIDLGAMLTDHLGEVFGEIITRQGSSFPFDGLFFDIENALDGDCMASWDLFFTAVQPFLFWNPVILDYTLAIQMALHEAYGYALEAVTKSVLGMLADQIFSASDNHWRSWAVRFEAEEIFNQNALLPEKGSLFNAFVVKNNLIQLTYTRTTDFTNRKLLSMEVTNLTTNSTETFDLGKWNNIDYSYTDQGFLLITGAVYSNATELFPSGNAMLIDLQSTDKFLYQYIKGDRYNGSLITAAQSFKVVANGQLLALEALDRVFLLPNTMGVELPQITGVTESKREKSVAIFPNPTSGLLNISGINEGEFVELYNSVGKMVMKQNISPFNSSIDLSPLPNGIYILKCNEQRLKVLKR